MTLKSIFLRHAQRTLVVRIRIKDSIALGTEAYDKQAFLQSWQHLEMRRILLNTEAIGTVLFCSELETCGQPSLLFDYKQAH